MKLQTRCAACGALNVGVCECRRRESNQRYDAKRPNSTARGYDRKWNKFRESILNERPLCQDCLEAGLTSPANEVHHIKKLREAPELRLEPSNVMCLCKACHSRRTARGE